MLVSDEVGRQDVGGHLHSLQVVLKWVAWLGTTRHSVSKLSLGRMQLRPLGMITRDSTG